MTAPWYTTPEALALIDSVTTKPETQLVRCPLGDFHYPTYVTPAGLHALWTAAAKEALSADPFNEAHANAVMAATPHAVMAALWGSAGWLDDDTYNVWPTIRAELAAVRMQVAA